MKWLIRKLVRFAHWINDQLYNDGTIEYSELQKNRKELATEEKKLKAKHEN